jgi:predicted CoA-binding protein
MDDMSEIRVLKQVLQQNRTIAVVGLSADWFRPSYFAAKYMQAHGYRIVPVNPKYTSILGEICYPDLAAIPHPIDMVDVFRKPADTPAIAEQAVSIGAKVLWLQLGVVNEQAQTIAEQAGLTVVMDRCVKIEHARLFGGLGWFGVNTGVISAQRQTPPSFTPHG